MTQSLEEQTRELASQPYSVEMLKDETTDGQMVVYVVRHPELEGCMAQGESMDDAFAELDAARYEYILSLLEDGLPVPAPTTMQTTTGDNTVISEEDTWSPEPEFLTDLEKAVQPETRHPLGTAELDEMIIAA